MTFDVLLTKISNMSQVNIKSDLNHSNHVHTIPKHCKTHCWNQVLTLLELICHFEFEKEILIGN